VELPNAPAQESGCDGRLANSNDTWSTTEQENCRYTVSLRYGPRSCALNLGTRPTAPPHFNLTDERCEPATATSTTIKPAIVAAALILTCWRLLPKR
jgi:hypothetical protein